MITSNNLGYLFLIKRLLTRPNLKIWTNFFRYVWSINRIRFQGPDALPFSPVSVVIWATSRCNKTCDFCHYHGHLNTNDASKMELTCERFQEILKHPRVAKALRICLYGGEPLLNEELSAMIRVAKSKGHLVTINTNGLLISKCSHQLLDEPPDLLSISYYPEDRQKIADPVKEISKYIPVRLIYLLSKNRMSQVKEFLDFAIQTGARMVRFDDVCPNSFSDEQPVDHDDSQTKKFIAQMNDDYGRKIDIFWTQPSKKHRDKNISTCRQMWSTMIVDGFGRTGPCCVWPVDTYQGDLFNEKDCWNSQRMVELRRLLRQGDFPSHCQTCSFLYDDPLGV